MKIETKFDVGQTVWQVYHEHNTVPCNICDGTGWVEIKGTSWLCPSCRGGKKMIAPDCYETHKEMIEQIRVGPSGVSYMVGLGTMIEADVFQTEEAAQAEADRLNMEAAR